MPALLEAPVRVRQRLTVEALRDEALTLYFAAVASGKWSQNRLAPEVGTSQSAISAAVNAPEEEASTHGAVYARLINFLSDKYEVVKEERVEYRVVRKG